MDSTVSEKYRKYLISLKMKGKNRFIVWGTDMEENEQDKLAIDDDGNILIFDDSKSLKEELSKSTVLFDRENFTKWLTKNKDWSAHTHYDLDEIGKHIDSTPSDINASGKALCMEMLNIQNMVLDYAYQVNNDSLIDILNNENNKNFRDYVCVVFFWKSDINEIEKSKQLFSRNFDMELFLEEMKMILSILDYPHWS